MFNSFIYFLFSPLTHLSLVNRRVSDHHWYVRRRGSFISVVLLQNKLTFTRGVRTCRLRRARKRNVWRSNRMQFCLIVSGRDVMRRGQESVHANEPGTASSGHRVPAECPRVSVRLGCLPVRAGCGPKSFARPIIGRDLRHR